MKYYSEKLNKFYDTAVDCEKAEFEAKEKENLEKIKKERELALVKEQKEKAAAERKALAAEVDEARKAYSDACKTYSVAQKAYREKLQEFCENMVHIITALTMLMKSHHSLIGLVTFSRFKACGLSLSALLYSPLAQLVEHRSLKP